MKNGGGQFVPILGGHFELESSGHFKLELGGQYDWNLHIALIILAFDVFVIVQIILVRKHCFQTFH